MDLSVDQAITELEHMISACSQRTRCIFATVKGGTGPETFPLLYFIDRYMKALGVHGHVGEIGVLYGQFLSAVSILAGPEEKIVAFDLFEDQVFNIDSSGSGVEATALANLRQFANHPDNVELVKGDSTALHTAAKLAELGSRFGEFKFFSVDGCHTKQHTMADIALGEKLLANGGLLLVDDFFNEGWTAVPEGTAAFFATRNIRLAPLAAFSNKLICTTISHQKLYHDAIGEWVASPHFSRHYGSFTQLRLYEYPIWGLHDFIWN